MPSTTQSRAVSFIAISNGLGKAEADVATPNPEFVEMVDRWQLVNDLMGGTPAMRAAGEKWLSKFPKETAAQFKARLGKATLFNVFLTTIQGLVGRVFREPITLTEETDSRVKEWAKNVDLQGRDLTAYGRDVFTDMLAFGLCHTMSEFPDTAQIKLDLNKEELTLEDEHQYNVRPYFAKVSPMSLFAWDATEVAGSEILNRIRIHEVQWVREGEWGQKRQQYIRVVEPNTVQLWKYDGKKWVLHGPEFANTIGEVNLSTGYARRTDTLIAAPPLEDLAWLNRKHWDSQSDQDNILHVVRAAILYLGGFKEDDAKLVNVGSSLALRNDNPDARVEYVEHSGKAVDAGQNSLDNLVEEMEASGAGDLLTSKPGVETATARAIGEAKTMSPLQAMALELQAHLEAAFKMNGRWINEPDIKVGVRVNTDLGTFGEETKEIELLQVDATANRISDEDYLREAQARGLYDSEVPIDEMLERAQNEADSAAPGLNPIVVVEEDE